MNRDEHMMIDVDIPVDIEGGFDPDGLPKVVPATERRKKASAAPPVANPEELETLRRERDTERAARTKAEKDAATAAEGLRGATGRLQEASGRLYDTQVQAYGAHYARVTSELQQITSAIAQTESLASSAERELAAAEVALANATDLAERTDIANRKVKAQRELARAEAELVTLQSGKHSAEGAVDTAKRYLETAAATADAARTAAVAEPAPAAAVKGADQPKSMTPDEWIDSCPSSARPWLREHKEFTSDPKQHRKLLRFADEYADDHGGPSALDSADFVAALNAKFFPKQEDDPVEEDDEPAAVEPARTRSAPAAPVSRSANPAGGGGGNGSGGGKVRLSVDEQATAVAMYPDMARPEALKKYATNKARAIADGLYAPRQ